MKQFPRNLKGDKCLAGAGGEREQDAVLAFRDGLQSSLYRDVLVVAPWVRAALILVGHSCEAIAPSVLLGEAQVPEFLRRRVAIYWAFLPSLHVDGIDAPAVAGVCKTGGQLAGIVLRLRHALGQFFIPGLRLIDGQLVVPIDQHVIRNQRLRALPQPFDAAGCDVIFAHDAAVLNHTPPGGFQRRVNVLDSGFSLVHWRVLVTVLHQKRTAAATLSASRGPRACAGRLIRGLGRSRKGRRERR